MHTTEAPDRNAKRAVSEAASLRDALERTIAVLSFLRGDIAWLPNSPSLKMLETAVARGERALRR